MLHVVAKTNKNAYEYAMCLSRHHAGSGREEGQYLSQQVLLRFFGNVMTAVEGGAIESVGKARPLLERIEAFFDDALLAPQGQHGAADLVAHGKIVTLMFQVNAGAGAVVFADAMDGGGVAQAAQVLCVSFRCEGGQ